MISHILPFFALIMVSVPITIAVAPAILLHGTPWEWVAIPMAPLLFFFAYILTAGTLSRSGVKAIVKGKFPRDLKHPVYGPRRLYGVSWTAVYYFTPLYFYCLSFRFTRGLLFRMFGYKGSIDITVYPDAWIRDLPLLQISDKVYISNRSTIGTNMCLNDGTIFVDPIRLDEGAIVGHLAMIAPGAKLGKNTELGVGNAFGIKSRMKDGSRCGPTTTVMHGASIGENVEIGCSSYIGLRVKIAANLSIPAGANIPAGADLKSQDEVLNYYTSETSHLKEARMAKSGAMFESLAQEA